MEILKADLKFKNALSKRKSTNRIILHHAAGSGMTVQQIHNMHINSNGWSGIGYHFYVRKNGEVWQGRPIDTIGAHCGNNNSDSIGICFEGNFENETMNETQLKAGIELVSYILSKYSTAKIYGHRDFNATACPGKNFPMDKIKKGYTNTSTVTSVKGDESMTTLKKGMNGVDAKVLQCLLNVNGAKLTVDGSFGTGTDTAVKEFQKSHGLVADGIVGAKTWEALSEGKVVSNTEELNKLKTKIANAIKALA